MTLSDDLASLKGITDEEFSKLFSIISDPDKKSIDWVVAAENVSGDEEKQVAFQSLFRIVNFAVNALASAREHNSELGELDALINKLSVTNDAVSNGWERIKRQFPSLDKLLLKRKEASIRSRFSAVEDFSITVDIRPVFNLEKTAVASYLYPSILKIETSDEKVFVCELHEDALDNLMSELQLAKKKMELIKDG